MIWKGRYGLCDRWESGQQSPAFDDQFDACPPRGGKVIVINPVRETGLINFRIPSDPISLLAGTKIASHYVQPHIGGDLALLWGIAKATKSLDALDKAFLDQHTTRNRAWLAAVDALSWQEIETKSGVARSEIESIAEALCRNPKSACSPGRWESRTTPTASRTFKRSRTWHSRAGMVGRPGCGLMPIRGHSNVQGIGSVGVTPKLKDQIFDSRLQDKLRRQLPETPGKDTLACMESAAEWRNEVGLLFGRQSLRVQSRFDLRRQALSNLEMNVMLNTTMNTGHAHGLAGDDHLARAGARRGTRPDDAGVDVQLRPPERRRALPRLAWTAQRSFGDRHDRQSRAARTFPGSTGTIWRSRRRFASGSARWCPATERSQKWMRPRKSFKSRTHLS
jgi:hypothetical protein